MTLVVNEGKHSFVTFRRIVAIMIIMTASFGGFGIQGADAQSLDDNNTFIPRRLLALADTVSQGFPQIAGAAEAEDPRVTAIRAYFTKLNMPAADYAEAFVRAADENDFEYWALLPAIARQETTGCKYTLNHPDNSRKMNCFGFGPKGYSFGDIEEGIDYVTATLAGNKDQTDHYYFKGQALKDILHRYNSVNPRYFATVTKYMADIEALVTESSDGEVVNS